MGHRKVEDQFSVFFFFAREKAR